MTKVRVGYLLAAAGVILIATSCGDYYRPIALPIQPTPPTPSALHYVLSLSLNGICPPALGEACGRGASSRIDVSGDTTLGSAQVGLNPVHAAVLPNGTNVYVANEMEDTVSYYSPSNVAPVSGISLPANSRPVFLNATDNTSVYVAAAGSNAVYNISTASEAIVRTIGVGTMPVALAELPNAQKVYVANRGSGANPTNGSVQVINALDGSVSAIGNSSWNSPVWAIARSDSARVYALDQGTGMVSAIDTSSDAVVGTAAVQPGANYLFYQSSRNHLYVTNPLAQTLTVLNAADDSLPVLASVSFAAGSGICPSGCVPLSVTVLPDGSRAYVVSYQIAPACSQAGDTPPCVTTQVTVLSAANYSVTKTIPVDLASGTSTKPDTPELAVCDAARFRVFTASSADSSRVYVSYCDAGATAVIRTTPDTSPGSENPGDYLVNNLPAPLSANPAPAPGLQPPPQNPVFVVPGP